MKTGQTKRDRSFVRVKAGVGDTRQAMDSGDRRKQNRSLVQVKVQAGNTRQAVDSGHRRSQRCH